MNKCLNCNKRVWFWNKFRRKYGKVLLLNKEKKELMNEGYFCSYRCHEEFLNFWSKR